MQPFGAAPELLKNKSAQDYSLLEAKWRNHFQAIFLTHYFLAVISREQFRSSLVLCIRQVWCFEGHVIILCF